uniref:Cytochrome P450 n=1 Tax=Lactuca sativa TaxID=4236 RepID=A0A9R1UUN2_LACSA|nr:hypothetical protein LSAT_V11C800434000 [Lactuca sativa]
MKGAFSSFATGGKGKSQKFFNIGSEKRLKEAVAEIRQFTMNIFNEKKQALTAEPVDLFSRFLNSSHLYEKHLTNIVISFILAGRDTTSAALTWFFWLLYKIQRSKNEALPSSSGGHEAGECRRCLTGWDRREERYVGSGFRGVNHLFLI